MHYLIFKMLTSPNFKFSDILIHQHINQVLTPLAPSRECSRDGDCNGISQISLSREHSRDDPFL